MELMKSRRRILLNTPHIKTASGSIASFTTDVPASLKQCLVQFSPVQSGTGDPSPTNVRPITGWTGVNVTRAGVNLWDEQWVVGAIESDGQIDTDLQRRRTTSFIPLRPGLTFFLKCPSSAGYGRYAYYDADKNLVQYDGDGMMSYNYTAPNNAYYLRITVGASYGETYNHDISINYPATDTSYHAYQGTTYPIDWTTEAGTVYGGTVDLATGEVVTTWSEVDLGTINWTYETFGGGCFACYGIYLPIPAKNYYVGVCDNYAFVGAYWNLNNRSQGIAYAYESGIAVKDTSITLDDPAVMKAGLAGVKLCYEIATPITYQLDPVTIATLKGTNNVWSNANGNITVQYWGH